MLHLGYVLLCYDLIYNLQVSFNFNFVFSLLPAIFFELLITQTFFDFP